MLTRSIQGLLLALALVSMGWQVTVSAIAETRPWFSTAFLIGLPVLLAILIGLDPRRMGLAVTMYSTIGLALDIATMVQELTQTDGRPAIYGLGMLSGVLNFLLIVCGGRAFLNGTKEGRPQAIHRPNPPPPFSP